MHLWILLAGIENGVIDPDLQGHFHILQGCFTGAPSVCEVTLKDIGKIVLLPGHIAAQ